MDSISSRITELGPAALVLKAIVGSLLGIALLIAFIVFRRWYRGLYFQRRHQRTLTLRANWDNIVSLRTPPQTWSLKRLDSEIIETILLDSIETAGPEEMPELLACLRASGLLDRRICEARTLRGLRQRTALVTLGRTRAPEAIPALAEALDAPAAETRIAAVRGLGRTGLPNAALPLLQLLVADQLRVPGHAVKNALLNCCRASPAMLIGYLPQSKTPARELLARVLAELATAEFGDELLVLATDSLPEVRASAARALGNAKPAFALSLLSALAQDSEWFVRLRAVVSLGSIDHPGRIRVLLRAVCDPNRYVRQRAAWVLAQMQPNFEKILEEVVATRDRYALEAFVSELERSGAFDKVAQAFEQPSDFESAAVILGKALAVGKQQAGSAAGDLEEVESMVP